MAQTSPKHIDYGGQLLISERPRNDDVMAKLVLAAFKESADGMQTGTSAQLVHPRIDVVARIRTEPVRAVPEGAIPKFVSGTVYARGDSARYGSSGSRAGWRKS